ncbi:MAG: excinuclease ABC subunit UvrA [Bacteroidia bacterium]|nr:excinuclease ABC subunit UvrA [Bacteroidia bacterium]MDW8158690.1 excinuclease ABC subunit UvrA [Bacteroidia bacterium]
MNKKKNYIEVSGAAVHNLKNISLVIPRDQLVVFTGVSGSGKSSLVFDTLYAEGYRRYVESLSSYARQFLARIAKPKVDYINGLSPAIAIEQRVQSHNPRSTVGSVTEIYDFLRLLFAKIGKTFSPISGKEVRCDTVSSVVDFIIALPSSTSCVLLAPINFSGQRSWQEELQLILQKGFTRIYYNFKSYDIEDILNEAKEISFEENSVFVIIQRLVLEKEWEEDFITQLADSVQTAFNEGGGLCALAFPQEQKILQFSENFEADGIIFEKPTEQLFNFNNPFGACPTCQGFGRIMGISEKLVVPDPTKSLIDKAIEPWKTPKYYSYHTEFLNKAPAHGFRVDIPYQELSLKEKELLWKGNENLIGIEGFFAELSRDKNRLQNRMLLARYRGYTFCPSCMGTRLRKEALYVKVGNYTIADFLAMSIDDFAVAFDQLQFKEKELQIASRIILEIKNRVRYLQNVGLGYLSLDRKTSTLSGGETQRINLATSLGSYLKGSMYILDEPSIGLHPRDADKLISILENLRDLGNSVLVVEHDEAIMKKADFLVELGPLAGEKGGEIVFSGTYEEMLRCSSSLTGKYLSGKEKIDIPYPRREIREFIYLRNARENNLKNLNVKFPLHCLTVVTGVSGSGKTTLIKNTLYNAIRLHLNLVEEKEAGLYDSLEGAINQINGVELIDQHSIGKSTRSNPVTYVNAWDGIRDLFASLPEAKRQQLKKSHFSFNVEGGRCEQCLGEGAITVQMQFLPDIQLECDSCKGKRFKQIVLDVHYRGKNIYDILCLTVEEAIEFFSDKPKIVSQLKPLSEVGLGYLRLGQSVSTLSGGEAQRLKLASFLQEKEKSNEIYIFDEPTTGLHFHDIKKLLNVFSKLIEKGNTVIVIEHNLEVIKCADWIIDLGPEGGAKGGYVVYEGRPEGLVEQKNSYTGFYLKEKLYVATHS